MGILNPITEEERMDARAELVKMYGPNWRDKFTQPIPEKVTFKDVGAVILKLIGGAIILYFGMIIAAGFFIGLISPQGY